MGSALALCLTTLYLVLLRASAFVLLVSLRPATSLAPPLRPFLARLVWRLASVGNQEVQHLLDSVRGNGQEETSALS
jgi:hypothetical protein